MTDVLAGATISAAIWPAAVAANDETAINNLASTSFAAGSPVVAVTFTAPSSGRVLITISGGFRDNAGTDRAILAPEVYEGTDALGTLVLGTTTTLETECTSAPEATAFYHVSRTTLLEGLTAGATHYARVMHKAGSGGGTADISRREIIVRPTT